MSTTQTPVDRGPTSQTLCRPGAHGGFPRCNAVLSFVWSQEELAFLFQKITPEQRMYMWGTPRVVRSCAGERWRNGGSSGGKQYFCEWLLPSFAGEWLHYGGIIEALCESDSRPSEPNSCKACRAPVESPLSLSGGISTHCSSLGSARA